MAKDILHEISELCWQTIPHYKEKVHHAVILMDETHYPLSMVDESLEDEINNRIEEWAEDNDADLDTLDITAEDIMFYE